jgi:hypothetical protein
LVDPGLPRQIVEDIVSGVDPLNRSPLERGGELISKTPVECRQEDANRIAADRGSAAQQAAAIKLTEPRSRDAGRGKPDPDARWVRLDVSKTEHALKAALRPRRAADGRDWSQVPAGDFLVWQRGNGEIVDQFLLSPASPFYRKPTCKDDAVDTKMFCPLCAGTPREWTQTWKYRAPAWLHDAAHQRQMQIARKRGTRPGLGPWDRIQVTLCWAIEENININQLCSLTLMPVVLQLPIGMKLPTRHDWQNLLDTWFPGVIDRVGQLIHRPGNYSFTVGTDASSHGSGRHTFAVVLSFSTKEHERQHVLIGIYKPLAAKAGKALNFAMTMDALHRFNVTQVDFAVSDSGSDEIAFLVEMLLPSFRASFAHLQGEDHYIFCPSHELGLEVRAGFEADPALLRQVRKFVEAATRSHKLVEQLEIAQHCAVEQQLALEWHRLLLERTGNEPDCRLTFRQLYDAVTVTERAEIRAEVKAIVNERVNGWIAQAQKSVQDVETPLSDLLAEHGIDGVIRGEDGQVTLEPYVVAHAFLKRLTHQQREVLREATFLEAEGEVSFTTRCRFVAGNATRWLPHVRSCITLGVMATPVMHVFERAGFDMVRVDAATRPLRVVGVAAAVAICETAVVIGDDDGHPEPPQDPPDAEGPEEDEGEPDAVAEEMFSAGAMPADPCFLRRAEIQAHIDLERASRGLIADEAAFAAALESGGPTREPLAIAGEAIRRLEQLQAEADDPVNGGLAGEDEQPFFDTLIPDVEPTPEPPLLGAPAILPARPPVRVAPHLLGLRKMADLFIADGFIAQVEAAVPMFRTIESLIIATQSEQQGAAGLMISIKRDFLKAIRAAPQELAGFATGCENKFWELQHKHQHHQFTFRAASLFHPLGFKFSMCDSFPDYPRRQDMVGAQQKLLEYLSKLGQARVHGPRATQRRGWRPGADSEDEAGIMTPEAQYHDMFRAKCALSAAEREKYTHRPFQFYEDYGAEWTELKPLAFYFLATEGTSAGLERLFSRIDWILGARRHRLTTQNMTKFAFLKANMQTLLDMLFGAGTLVMEPEE